MADRKAATLKKGDKVTWETSQGKTQGTVVRKVTGTAQVLGHTAKASASQPQFEVESDKTGKHAIHKPQSLKKGSHG